MKLKQNTQITNKAALLCMSYLAICWLLLGNSASTFAQCTSQPWVTWNLNTCASSFSSYSEFTPTYPSSCASVTATTVYRDSPSTYTHSCVAGANGSTAGMCITGANNQSYTSSSATKVKYGITVNTTQPRQLTKLKLYAKSPTVQTTLSGTVNNNNYLRKFGVRIYKAGSTVFTQKDIVLTTSWQLYTIDLSTDPDFQISANTTFSIEMVAYDPVGNGYSTRVWDIDEISIEGCCSSTATVNCSDIVAGSIGSNQTICTNGDPAMLTSVSNATTTYSGGVKYIWLQYVGATAPTSNTGATVVSGATGATYDPAAGSVTATTWFRRCAAPNSSTCTTYNGESNWVSVTVNTCTTVNCSDIVAGSIGSNQTICTNGDPAMLTSVSNATTSYSGGVKYIWLKYVGATAPTSNTGATTISGATGATYDPPLGSVTATTWFRRCAAPNSSTCTSYNGESNWVSVTVNSCTTTCTGNLLQNSGFENGLTNWENWGYVTLGNTPYSGSANATICTTTTSGGAGQMVNGTAGTTYTSTVYAKVSGTPDWAGFGIDFLDANYNEISEVVTQITATNYTLHTVSGVAPAGTVYVQTWLWKNANGCLYVDDYCFTSSGGGATVNCSDVTPGTIGSNQTICTNGDPAMLTSVSNATTSYSGGVKYVWLKYVGATAPTSNTGATVISGATGATYDPPLGSVTATTWFRRCAAVNSTSCTNYPGESNWVSVTVNSCTTTCTGNLLQNPGMESGLTAWQNWGYVTVGTTPYSGAANATICNTNAGGMGQDVSVTAGLTYTLTAYAKVSGSPNWAGLGINFYDANWTELSAISSNDILSTSYTQYTVSGTAPAGAVYATASMWKNANGCLYVDDFCFTSSGGGTTVNCSDAIAGIIGYNQTICAGGDPSNIVSLSDANTSYSGGVKYVWLQYVGATAPTSNTGSTVVSGATGASYDPPAGSVTATTWFRRCAAVNSTSCTNYPGESNWVSVTVSPNPSTPSGSTATSNVCPATTVNLSTMQPTSPSTTGGVFEWHVTNSSSSALVSNPSAVGAGTYYLFEKSSAGCYSSPKAVTVTINTCGVNCSDVTPGTIGSNQTVCSGGDPAMLTSVSNATTTYSGGVKYVWLQYVGAAAPTNDVGATVVAGATGASYDPPAGSVTATTWFRRCAAVNSTSCTNYPGESNWVSVTVSPTPAMPSGATATSNVCPATTVNLSTMQPTSPSTVGGVFEWHTTNSSSSALVSNPSAVGAGTYYLFEKSSAGCYSAPKAVTVTINACVNCADITGGSIGSNQTICVGGDPAAFTSISPATTSYSGGVKYQWFCYVGATAPSNMSLATAITGATGITYDAPAGSVTAKKWFRRCAAVNNASCTAYYGESAWVCVDVVTCALPTISITDITVTEGTNPTATLQICASATSNMPITVVYTTSNNSATSGSDYTSTSATATIPAGQTCVNVTFPILDDAIGENTETFNVTLSNPSGATISDNTGVVTILDNDGANCSDITPGIIGSNQTICTGGDPAMLTSIANASTSYSGGVKYVWLKYVGATAPTSNTGVTTIAGATGATYDPPAGSVTAKTWFRRCAAPNSSTCTTYSGESAWVCIDVTTCTLPTISISDITVTEGTNPTATLQICASATSTTPITVVYTTSNNTAMSGSDYTSTSATATIPAGQTCVNVTFPILDDAIGESTETFNVTLSSPTGATINDGTGVVTILDNDGVNCWDITGGSIGSNQTICTGGDAAAFTNISSATTGYVGGVKYIWLRYVGASAPPSNTDPAIVIIPGATSNTYDPAAGSITAKTWFRRCAAPNTADCTNYEGETQWLCVDVVTCALPTLSIGDITVTEGTNPTATLQICASTTSATPITVVYSTSNNTAMSGSDYTSTSATATIPAGQTCVNVSFPILDDATSENPETFNVTLSNPSGATISDNTGVVTILDNDGSATCSNVTDAGAIGYYQSNTNAYDPEALVETTAATGGSGTLQYIWQSSSDNWSWATIAGATGASYDPSTISTTTFYRRGVRRSNCSDYLYTASVMKQVDANTAVNCYDVVGGAIGYNQSVCAGGDPAPIVNITAATTTQAAGVRYQWFKFVGDVAPSDPSFVGEIVWGAEGESYDPPQWQVWSRTWYRRCAGVNDYTCNNNYPGETVWVMVDVTGGCKTELSSSNELSPLQIVPVPANNFATLNFDIEVAQTLNIQVADLSGRIVLQQQYAAQVGSNSTQLDISHLSNGYYLVQVTNDRMAQQAKLVIVR
jgi:hypothetical protein